MINAQPTFVPWIMNSLLVLALTSYRVVVATNPFVTMTARTSTARGVCVVLWCVGFSVFFLQLGYGSTSSFDPISGKCVSSIYKDERTQQLFLWYVVIGLSLTPLCLIIILNGILGVIAVRTSKSVRAKSNYKGLIMVCARNQPNQELLLSDWRIASHVT